MPKLVRSICASVAIFGAPAMAHSESATDPRASQVYTLTLTAEEMDLVWDGAGRLPFAQVAPLMAKMRSQIQAQAGSRPAPPSVKQEVPLAEEKKDGR
jgi:hypothetical protein